jgi:hypothetical protein
VASARGAAAEGSGLRARPRRVDGEERLRGQFEGFDWAAARDLAAAGTRLYPGDVLAGPPLSQVDVEPGCTVEIVALPIGAFGQSVSRD